MKLISLIQCIFLILFTSAYAEDIIKCVDANGNTILTSDPQDGMKCFVEQPKKEPKKSVKINLVEYCAELSSKLEDIKEKKNDMEGRRAKLYKELEDYRKNSYKNNLSYDLQNRQSQPIVNKIENLGEQYSALNIKENEINEEMRSYKCDEMYDDMSMIQ